MKKVFFVLISNFILALTLTNKVFAQDDLGVNELANGGIALGTRSIQDTIAGIINIFLGFLGILATLLILYGGYLWMTSRGNSEKVEKAKLLIASAVIGLVIILSAYAISRFILSRLYDTTGGGGGSTTTPPVVIIPSTCSTPTNPDDPRICSISRTAGPVSSRLTLYGYNFDTTPNGSPDGVGKVELVDTATGTATEAEVVECASSAMWQDGMVRVRIPDTLAIGNYQVVLTNDINISTSVTFPLEIFDFTVNNDPTNVFVDCINPNPVLVEDLPRTVDILGEGFGATQAIVTMSGGVDGTTLLNLNVNTWSDLQINVDIPTNAISSNVIVDVFGDTDYDRLNISCDATTEGQCVSGCCSASSCVQESICNGTAIIPVDAPVIQSISPEDGEAGTLVTIFGYNFGDSANPGTVTIGGDTALVPFCGNIWNDNYIIVEVPAGDGSNALFDVVVTEAAALGGEASDPYVGFDRNDTVRPGICALSATDGSYGDDIDIDGVNFTGATAHFDTVASYQTTIADPNNAIAEVPNVVGNLGVTMRSPSSIDSNPFPFSALAITGGGPVITELSPDNGPVESYVTIIGSNFGDNVGLVLFDPDSDPTNGNEVPGTFDFPSVCGDYWFNDHIIVKVPAGPWTIDNSYPIRIERNGDGAVSNNFNFRVTNVPPGPQICSVSPDNGPVGNLVTISGEAFGTSGDVLFYDGATGVSAASIINWSPNQAFGVEVPLGASTGPVVVQDAAGNNSNGIIFNVGACSNNLQCGVDVCCTGASGNYCAASCGVVPTACEYYWDVSTQAEPFGLVYNYSCASGLQSPSPWPDGHDGVDASGFLFPQSSLDAFVDTNITALFTRDVRDADFNTTNIILHQCDAPGCASYTTDVTGLVEIINQNSDREGFVFNPNTDLLPGTWYEVELGTFHAAIGADSWTPDPVLDEWIFQTRDSGLLCEVSSIAVTPQSPQANIYPGQEMNFSSSPLAANCNVCGGSYDWQWSISHNPGPVSSYASNIPLANTDVNNGFTRLTGGPGATQLLPAAADNFVTVEATNLDYPAAGVGQSYPIILAPILRIENKVPNCDDSCGNAQIWVDFNTELQLPLAPSQFELHQCDDATCSTWAAANLTSSIDATTVSRRVELDGLTTALVGGQSYIVIVDAGVTNIYGYPLGGSLAERSWTFTVGTENCQMTSANILPDNYTAYSFNGIAYNGYAMANGGSCGEQAIHCDTCDWDWTESSGGTIASIDTGAQNVLATPAGINGSTNINLTIDGSSMSYGTVLDSTPLTINVSGGTSVITDLSVVSYWPNCGACTNSMAEIWFNSDLQASTVNDTNIRIYNITDGVYDAITILPIIANRHISINHGLFDLGKQYRLEVSDAVLNTANDNIVGGWQSPPFTIENDGCLADAVWVDPATATAAASQSINYRAVTTYNAAACGPTPITCSTCNYNWQDNSLGTIISGDTTPNAVFQTLATVMIGQSDIVTLDAQEGTNILPVTDGLLTIGGIPLNVVDYWPNCDGACTNSQVVIRFDSPINEATIIPGAYLISDITGLPSIVSNGYTLTGGGRTLIIEHDPFILGHLYRVTIRTSIANIYGQNPPVQNIMYPDTALRWTFTTGVADCRVQSVDVDPAIQIATASQPIDYNAVTLANTVSCGDLPVYCDSCTYTWRDWPNDLGDFNNLASRNPIFTTAPTVVNGNSTNIEVDVLDQGQLFEDFGILGINVGPSLTEEVSLIENNPAGGALNICNNVAPYVVFDISGGDLNRNSLVSHFGLYEQCVSGWCLVPGAIRFIDATPGRLTAVYEQSNILSNFTRYFVGFDDASQVLGQNGNPIVDMNPDPGFANWNYIGANDLGWYFDTADQSCAAHSVQIDPEEDLFTCIDPNSCVGDESSSNSGNQHLYESFTYDIRGQVLIPASLVYNWVSADNSIVVPITSISQSILGTAGTNGLTNLGVQVHLASQPANIVSDSSPVEVNTCQAPWPSLATYPWDDTANPDMNFSTYYCQNYGNPDEVSLPYIDIPHITSSPDPNILREYISTIYYGTVLNEKNPYFGSLAYTQPKENKISSWREKLSALFKTEEVNSQSLGCTPMAPSGLSYTYDGANTLVFSWTQPRRVSTITEDPEYFEVQRLESGVDTDFVTKVNLPVRVPNAAGSYSFTDNTVTANGSYRYRVIAHNNTCTPSSIEPIEYNPTLIVSTAAGGSLVDIIGFRVMKNEEHLSVLDWYRRNAPNPEEVGTIFEVDGYEALQVGGTIYVSATNFWSDTLYTNIYIIAHNVGANAPTLNIYNQMLDNFKLNIDMSPATMTNTCHSDSTITCSSDFDCPVGYCDSQGLKIRRDVKRLGDLMKIKKAILSYGENHKACSNNSLISCNQNSDCPSIGTCVSYFPPLNAGSYLNGLSNSSWPSWQETLANHLDTTISADPINLFNGCTSPYNSETCWDEVNRDFSCPANSLVYIYNILGVGQDYYLGANFEYDMYTPTPTTTFIDDLDRPPANIDFNINNPHCDASSVDAPGFPNNPYCGNGVLDTNYCTIPCDGCSGPSGFVPCNLAGGEFITAEECDNEFWNYACSESPATASPAIPTVGNHEWWNEQTIGCNRRGAIDSTGNLVECTWYRPDPAFTAGQCGGYCGDGTLQSYYETCDGAMPAGDYHCRETGVTPYCGTDSCQVLCNNAGNIYPAALCGDGIWSEGTEQCDPSANPVGLAGWDCSSGGSISCSNSCQRVCSTGVPYEGICGDGTYNPSGELCDYENYTVPSPVMSRIDQTYGCTTQCLFDGRYCGDGVQQYSFGELCEISTYERPEPIFSDIYNQYECSSECRNDQAGGYCGDGLIQDGVASLYDYGEDCDPGSPWDSIPANPPALDPTATDRDHQYACDVDCVGFTGGWCGDGNANELYEVCDGADYPERPTPAMSRIDNTYACAGDCSGGAVGGGYCGDGITNQIYFEGCDWGIPEDSSYWPWPRGLSRVNFSDPMNQYVCSSCMNTGGYCGNGVVDGSCTANCSNLVGGVYTSNLNCSEAECIAQSGVFSPYEQCDSGFDPAYVIEKNVDLVYVFDMSGSMAADATALCSSTQNVASALDARGIAYRISIMVLGDSDGAVLNDPNFNEDDGTYGTTTTTLTATTDDDIDQLFGASNNDWLDEAQQVFRALVTDCALYQNNIDSDPSNDFPNVRYLSFYDNATNDIGTISINGDTPTYPACSDSYDYGGRLENWGYATREIASHYNWQPGYHRVIVPVSDEAAYCGGNISNNINENYDAATLPDILVDAVTAARATDPMVHISPVLLRHDDWLMPVGQAVANDTGGLFTNSTSNWAAQTINVINSTFCDGDGDGHMDCKLVP